MVDVDMSPMPPKVIGSHNCLWVISPSRLSKDLGPKRHPNIWRREESKEIKDFVKLEDGGMHRKRYDGHCMKWIIILQITWKSPILKKRSTCWTSFRKAYLIKDDVKIKVPNGTFKTLIPSNGGLKSNGKLKNDHAIHLWGWIKRSIAQSLI